MLREEVEEIVEAIKANDPGEVVDGVMDVLFVAIGTLHKMGYDVPDDFLYHYSKVVDSNFTKFPFTKREDGKVKKSERFVPPNIKTWGESVFVSNGETKTVVPETEKWEFMEEFDGLKETV